MESCRIPRAAPERGITSRLIVGLAAASLIILHPLSEISLSLAEGSFQALEQLAPEQVFEQLHPGIVKVEAFGGALGNRLGTGFLVKPTGVIVTNHHVIAGAHAVRITLASGEIFDDVGLVDSDRRRDIAVLRIKASSLPTVDLGPESEVKPGQRIVVIGHPGGLLNTISEGLISAVRRADEVPGLGHGYQVYQISSPTSPGSSGGVVANLTGEVIGIPFAGRDGGDLNFAIPIRYAIPLLSEEVSEWFESALAVPGSPPGLETDAPLTSGLEPALPPTILFEAKSAYLGYRSGHRAVFRELPKKLNKWGRWHLTSSEIEADLILVYSQTGRTLLDQQLGLDVYDRAGRRLIGVNCLRRLGSGYTAGVLVNRLKKRIRQAEKNRPASQPKQ